MSMVSPTQGPEIWGNQPGQPVRVVYPGQPMPGYEQMGSPVVVLAPGYEQDWPMSARSQTVFNPVPSSPTESPGSPSRNLLNLSPDEERHRHEQLRSNYGQTHVK